MINTGIKVNVFDLNTDDYIGVRSVYIDKLGYSFIKIKGHFLSLLYSYDFYESHPRVYVDFNSGIVY